MMASLLPALSAWGVPARTSTTRRSALHPRRRTSTGTAPALAVPVEVRFSRSGRTLVWDGHDPTLLDFAERHGVAVESGCRSGSCGSCETRLVSGSVQYGHKPDHDIAPGHCLLCVGTPESALVLEA